MINSVRKSSISSDHASDSAPRTTRFTARDGLLESNLVTELLERISALQLLQLYRSVLVQELVDREETTADSDLDFIFLNPNSNLLRTELVHTRALPHEHNLQPVPIWVVVDELGHLHVHRIVFDWNVYRDAGLQFNDVVLECVALELEIPDSLE